MSSCCLGVSLQGCYSFIWPFKGPHDIDRMCEFLSLFVQANKCLHIPMRLRYRYRRPLYRIGLPEADGTARYHRCLQHQAGMHFRHTTRTWTGTLQIQVHVINCGIACPRARDSARRRGPGGDVRNPPFQD